MPFIRNKPEQDFGLVINLTPAQEEIRNKILAGEYKLLPPPHQQKEGIVPGSMGVRIYSPVDAGYAGCDVLDVIMILGMAFFENRFGEKTRLFAFGVSGNNIPFGSILQGMVIQGWKSSDSYFGTNDKSLWLGG